MQRMSFYYKVCLSERHYIVTMDIVRRPTALFMLEFNLPMLPSWAEFLARLRIKQNLKHGFLAKSM